MARKKIRIHDLAKELGMTNAETIAVAKDMGFAQVKTHSSSVEDVYADQIRRKAKREGLTRDEQPEEAAKPKKAKSKSPDPEKADKAEATEQAETADSDVEAPGRDKATAHIAAADEPKPADVSPSEEVKAEPSAEVETIPEVASRPEPSAQTPAEPVATSTDAATPDEPEMGDRSPVDAEPTVEPVAAEMPVDGDGAKTISSAGPQEAKARVDAERAAAAAEQAETERAEAKAAATERAEAKAEEARPLSPSGKPIPPPPGVPLSPSGKPIPPPPGSARAANSRTGAPSAGPRSGGFTGRPGGGGPRPGGGPGPGGGGPRPGGGGRPSGGRRPPRRSKRRRRRDRDELKPQEQNYTPASAPVPDGTIVVERGVSAQEFGPKLNRTAADVVKFLMNQGELIAATAALSDDHMELYALDLGADLLLVDPGQQQEIELQALFDDADDDDETLLQPRPPVITVMGHVDHGKTTLLDRIRSAHVVDGEAGGITQHIGAYQVEKDGKTLTFLDTPGHAAFSQMRARGADVTDIVVLVVAADDGVMPQTEEAISHARSAEVPIVVAVNKIDKDNANPERVLTELAERELVPEAWGGDTIVVEMSAIDGLGVDDLLDNLNAVAELEELDANPTGRAKGVVLEANLDKGRGPVATVLVDKGELKVGDPIVAGHAWGRVRAMINDRGEQVKTAGPSTPVEVLGLSTVPEAGDEFRAAPDEKVARTVGEAREHHRRIRDQRGDARVKTGVKLEDIFEQIQSGETATLNLILKADVQGSLEAVTESLRKLSTNEVDLTFVHRAVGGISENDITLAATTNATIIGFNVRPDRKAREAAETENVEIRTYEIIYKLLEDVEQAMVGMLAPEYEEVVTGEAQVREIFRVPRIGAIAGCYVTHGVITRGSKVRFLRDGSIIWKGSIDSLKRFKEDAMEVRAGFECGIGLSDFQDLKEGDVIETFEERQVERTLS